MAGDYRRSRWGREGPWVETKPTGSVRSEEGVKTSSDGIQPWGMGQVAPWTPGSVSGTGLGGQETTNMKRKVQKEEPTGEMEEKQGPRKTTFENSCKEDADSSLKAMERPR